jgi:hypothetical protein
LLNNEEQNGQSNRRDPEYRVNEWDEMNGEEDKFVQSAIQEEFNKIANEEEKET